MARGETGGCDAANRPGNIAVGDASALFYWLHCDVKISNNPHPIENVLMDGYARNAAALGAFNVEHPLFGGPPVSVLVPERNMRVRTKRVVGCLCTADLPENSFTELRDNLYVASPELTAVRMGGELGEVALAEAMTNLCGKYYLDARTESIIERKDFLTSPEAIGAFAEQMAGERGTRKVLRALRWVLPNSASPMETKAQLLFRLPTRMGGFGLPFTDMNYVVMDSRFAHLCEQGWYSIDLAAPQCKIGLEYDGAAYHQSASGDHRRRNALKAMGWEVFPMDKSVVFDADATERLAHQIAVRFQQRIRKPKNWENKHAQVRLELGLPA